MLQEPLYQRNIEAVGIVGRKGVEFVSLKENIDTTTPQGRFMLTVFGALAELERENILERTEKMIFHQTFHDWTKKEEKDFSLSSCNYATESAISYLKYRSSRPFRALP